MYEFNPNQQKEDTQKVSIVSTDSRQFQEKLRLNVLLKGISSHNDNMLSLPRLTLISRLLFVRIVLNLCGI